MSSSSPPHGGPPAFTSKGQAALFWLNLGLDVIPLLSGQKITAVKWDSWLPGLSPEKVTAHYTLHPDHDVGAIVGSRVVVMDADGPESLIALHNIEADHGPPANLSVNTSKGRHHYFRVPEGVCVKSDSHSTKDHPKRIDVKTGRGLIALPPSGGRAIYVYRASTVSELNPVSQDFIDAVFAHNGRPPPRPTDVATPQSRLSLPTDEALRHLSPLLGAISPDCGYEDWTRILMAIHHETQGSEAGLALADLWSSKGKKYKGTAELRAKWRSFKLGLERGFTIALLRRMVTQQGLDWMELCADAEPGFGEVAGSAAEESPFDKFALNDHLEDLEARAVTQVALLGQLVAVGEATILYAAPNTGKTLLTLSLINDAVRAGRLHPSKVYYINFDDSGPGLLEKARLARACGIKMLTDGERGFEAHHVPRLLLECAERDSTDTLVVIDTIKKVANLMNKDATSGFTQVVRKFVKKGGTFVGMAHVNKGLGMDGKPIYAGVSDTKDDCDAAHIMWTVPGKEGSQEAVVMIENRKRRFPVARKAAYAYSVDDDHSYEQKLNSVRQLDTETMEALQHAADKVSDENVIQAFRDQITSGINLKMDLAKEAMQLTGTSRNNALRVLDKYTGSDPAVHLWNFVVGPRNANLYYLLQTGSPVGTIPKPA